PNPAPEPAPEPAPAPEHEPAPAPAPAEKPKVTRVRYKCPKCGTEGTLDADKMQNIITCHKCGRAMHLVLKNRS
ncbi:MAG: hypothetical protein J6333_01760, partial [Planctomycetes bacterium]|nr:hypothetical protein [Planctomycetota bacterium]